MKYNILGGYTIEEHLFYPHMTNFDSDTNNCIETIPVLVYIADAKSPHWLGEDSLENIARQIVDSRGPCGENAEYLLRLAQFMHDVLPEVYDGHLFDLEKLVLRELKRRQVPLYTVMRENKSNDSKLNVLPKNNNVERRRLKMQYANNRITKRKLRRYDL